MPLFIYQLFIRQGLCTMHILRIPGHGEINATDHLGSLPSKIMLLKNLKQNRSDQLQITHFPQHYHNPHVNADGNTPDYPSL